MSKTQLTKAIEQALLNWNPAKMGNIKINKFRGEHTALEVPVTCGTTVDGIVDAVRVSEYFDDIRTERICTFADLARHVKIHNGQLPCGLKLDSITGQGDTCSVTCCPHNGSVSKGKPKVLITCFEIKISESDFRSSHGHNFVGNLNYYVVPKELADKIKTEVPPNIGILACYNIGGIDRLRCKKPPLYMKTSDTAKMWMVLSVMKRIRGMDYQKAVSELKNSVY